MRRPFSDVVSRQAADDNHWGQWTTGSNPGPSCVAARDEGRPWGDLLRL